MSTEIKIKDLLPPNFKTDIAKQNFDLDNTTFVGIDFGTSTSVVSISTIDSNNFDIHSESIWLKQKFLDGAEMKADKIPTVISWYDNKLLVGAGASDLKYFLKKGVNVWYSFKMELGEDLGARYYNSQLNNEKISIRNPKDAVKIFFKYLSVQIKRYVKEKNLPSNINYSVSIPASFEANQRKELVEALEFNNIKVTKQALIDEPNAAFLSYLQTTSQEGKPLMLPATYNLQVLVFDFGAGTCDVSILDIGKDINGVYSKNLAISRFEKLGGDDIDRYIALEILLPKLLQANGYTKTNFRLPEINKGILPMLLKTAEELKILICSNVTLKKNGTTLPTLAISSDHVKLGYTLEIQTSKGLLTLAEPSLSYAEFNDTMSVFLQTNNRWQQKRTDGQEAFVSIFNPIKSALKKAALEKNEVDYVLFIGGSSKNPYVQTALTDFFDESEMLIPKDLQTHVSIGASIHSLVLNGFNKNLIQPITSEPILLLTKDNQPRVVLPAGTEIPSDLIVIDDLTPHRDGQDIIELPLFVGSLNKMLFNVRIYSNKTGGFKKNTKVKVELEINADKLVHIRATADGVDSEVQPLNPFANRELTTEERMVLKIEKQANLEAEKNGGKPTESSLRALYHAYNKTKQYLKAAETLELLGELYPHSAEFNNVGVAYSNAGQEDKAIKFYEKAYQENRNQTAAFNLALEYKYKDRKRYKELLEECYQLAPNDPKILCELGRNKLKEGDESGKVFLEKAFTIFKRKFDQNRMKEWEFNWFANTAEALDKDRYAQTIRNAKPKFEAEKWYNEENLTETFQEKGLIEF